MASHVSLSRQVLLQNSPGLPLKLGSGQSGLLHLTILPLPGGVLVGRAGDTALQTADGAGAGDPRPGFLASAGGLVLLTEDPPMPVAFLAWLPWRLHFLQSFLACSLHSGLQKTKCPHHSHFPLSGLPLFKLPQWSHCSARRIGLDMYLA